MQRQHDAHPQLLSTSSQLGSLVSVHIAVTIIVHIRIYPYTNPYRINLIIIAQNLQYILLYSLLIPPGVALRLHSGHPTDVSTLGKGRRRLHSRGCSGTP
ncbi:hypothetical protein D1872_223100 [compost metagenome]